MNLDAFIFEQLQAIEEFEQFWREHQANEAESYPDEMTAGQWDEQLVIWRESQRKPA